jgi:glycosyltransferase involved in cell wall biosynthesis
LQVVHLVGNNLPVDPFVLFARSADPKRVSLTIGSLDREGPLQHGLTEIGIPTFSLRADHRASYPKGIVRFVRLLRRQRADVLHTHLFEACLVGLTAGRLARVPVNILTAHHSHEIPLHARRLLTLADRLAVGALCDHVIAPSASLKDTLVTVHRVGSDKIVVIPPMGLDLSVFDPTRTSGASFRSRHGIGGGVLFGAVSRYFWIKNLEGLVRAFPEVVRMEPDAKLVVVGQGDRSALGSLVDALGLGDSVQLLGPVNGVADVYAALDVLVHPALAESFGQAVVEGMAMATPVVATPVGVAPEVIDDGRTGFLTDGTGPQALAAGMIRALKNRHAWPDIGAAARKRVLVYTPQAWADAHENAYESWFAAARQRRPNLKRGVCGG